MADHASGELGISEVDYFALPKRFNPTHYDPERVHRPGAHRRSEVHGVRFSRKHSLMIGSVSQPTTSPEQLIPKAISTKGVRMRGEDDSVQKEFGSGFPDPMSFSCGRRV